jgi:hypothetical protein
MRMGTATYEVLLSVRHRSRGRDSIDAPGQRPAGEADADDKNSDWQERQQEVAEARTANARAERPAMTQPATRSERTAVIVCGGSLRRVV